MKRHHTHYVPRNRRAQAALEFIMTYGWAILVVLVMIGALAYMGIANPRKFIPESCTFSTGVGCQDFLLTHVGTDDLRVQFTLENSLGKPITIGPVNISSRNGGGVVCVVPAGTMGAGDTKAFDCTIVTGAASPGVDQQTKIDINMSYIASGGSYYHRVDGEIQGIVT